jgi:hypothetical protein
MKEEVPENSYESENPVDIEQNPVMSSIVAVRHYTTITFWFTAALPPLYGSSNTVKAAAVSA